MVKLLLFILDPGSKISDANAARVCVFCTFLYIVKDVACDVFVRRWCSLSVACDLCNTLTWSPVC